jgi:type I restriction enzyme S subunit
MSSLAKTIQSTLLSDLFKGIQSWSVPVKDIYTNDGLRLDATHYDREAVLAVRNLQRSGLQLKPLSEFADVRLPGQFTRIWAKGPEHGYRYINGSELINISGLGAIEKEPRYLSKLTKTNIDKLIIREGWLLVTCSGTIGRILYVSERFDGWAATHDLIRVIPKKPNHLGYLYAYLASATAQAQILGHTHGGQIDHITHHQLKTILVPLFPEDELELYDKEALSELVARDNSVGKLVKISDRINKYFTENE